LPTFDITTLALLGMFSNLIFASAAFAAWRLIPEERCLRDWGFALSCLMLGAAELALRHVLLWPWTIPLGNSLLALGDGWIVISLCHLIGLKTSRRLMLLPLGVALFTLCIFVWFTLVMPSLNIRLALFSVEASLICLVSTWVLLQYRDATLRRWMKMTVLMQISGVPLYLLRAWSVWHGAGVSADYSKTDSLLIAAPGFFYLIYLVWMSVTMILVLTARMRSKVIETLGFNRQILAHSPLATAVYRVDGECVLINAAFAQLLERGRDILMRQNIRHQPHWRTAGLLAACDRAIAEGQPQRIEFHTATPTGRLLWIDCRIRTAQLRGEPHMLLQLTDLTERKLLEDQLRQMAFHDPLTRLPNRRLLMDRIEQAQRASERDQSHAALVFIDLDQFKQLNDRHGHVTGDRLLVEVARTLGAIVRNADTVARLGGDEFVIMLTGLSINADEAMHNAQLAAATIHRALNRTYELGAVSYPASASLGLRLFSGTAEIAEHLLGDADSAMYRSKNVAAGAARPG
jgi:diguanylate cyclase (GGDEF)-like protein/PAS domain S-box-containing protein